ncbi:uncharacterized protein [Periplaneta americana]|uniref:uncharacterized protein n=1 Tax=Periplaneta americana TaxID=6978 RepID=UPI0037E7D595
MDRKYVCSICDKSFTKKGNCKRHMLTHGVKFECNAACESTEFKSLEEFLTWKDNIERKTTSSYVKQRGEVKKRNGDVHIYYNCCRSGVYRPRGRGRRPSTKIGSKCPARIHVKIKDGRIFAQHFHQHEKHQVQLQHTKLFRRGRSVTPDSWEDRPPQETKLDLNALVEDQSLLVGRPNENDRTEEHSPTHEDEPERTNNDEHEAQQFVVYYTEYRQENGTRKLDVEGAVKVESDSQSEFVLVEAIEDNKDADPLPISFCKQGTELHSTEKSRNKMAVKEEEVTSNDRQLMTCLEKDNLPKRECEPPVKCELCGEVLGNTEGLISHLRVHTGE